MPSKATSRGFRTGNQPLQSKNMGGKAASYLLKEGFLCIGMTFLVHFLYLLQAKWVLVSSTNKVYCCRIRLGFES